MYQCCASTVLFTYDFLKIVVKWKSLSCVWLFAIPWTIQSTEFSRPTTGVGSLSLLQGIFQTQGLNPGLLHCRWILYQLSRREALKMVVQFSSVIQSCLTLCDPMNRSTPGLPVHHQLPELTQTHVHRVDDAIQPSHPLASPSPPAPNPFQHQGLFQWVNSSHEVAKVLEIQFYYQSFQRTPRTDLQDGWLDLLAIQRTLKSLLQHHSSKASILRCSAFLTVQLSHPYMTTGKTIALTRWTFVGKVMSLLLNMLSRLVITFLPRSKPLLI